MDSLSTKVDLILVVFHSPSKPPCGRMIVLRAIAAYRLHKMAELMGNSEESQIEATLKAINCFNRVRL